MTRSYAAPVSTPDVDPHDPMIPVFEDVYHWLDENAVLRMVADYRQRGWTDEMIAVTEALADWAIEHRLGAADDQDVLATWSTVWVRIATCWNDLTVGRGDPIGPTGLNMDAAEARAWLTTAVGAPDSRTYLRIRELINQRRPNADQEMACWRTLGTLAPLAYAAGFTLTDAYTAHEADRLDAESLRVLAGLNGWRVPAV